MTRLVLFCGGPSIYPGGVPKPLQAVDNDQTLLELYLKTPFASEYSNVVLLCESSFLGAFREVLKLGVRDVEATLVETRNGSTTLEKLATYLDSCPNDDCPVAWTYPDIFYFGTLLPPDLTDWSERAVLSVRPMTSRFPRIVVDPYRLRVRSISTHQSMVPANPVHLFGGHLLASPYMLSRALPRTAGSPFPNIKTLEFDAFSWMISRGIIDALPLDGAWYKADGHRDLREITRLVNGV